MASASNTDPLDGDDVKTTSKSTDVEVLVHTGVHRQSCGDQEQLAWSTPKGIFVRIVSVPPQISSAVTGIKIAFEYKGFNNVTFTARIEVLDLEQHTHASGVVLLTASAGVEVWTLALDETLSKGSVLRARVRVAPTSQVYADGFEWSTQYSACTQSQAVRVVARSSSDRKNTPFGNSTLQLNATTATASNRPRGAAASKTEHKTMTKPKSWTQPPVSKPEADPASITEMALLLAAVVGIVLCTAFSVYYKCRQMGNEGQNFPPVHTKPIAGVNSEDDDDVAYDYGDVAYDVGGFANACESSSDGSCTSDGSCPSKRAAGLARHNMEWDSQMWDGNSSSDNYVAAHNSSAGAITRSPLSPNELGDLRMQRHNGVACSDDEFDAIPPVLYRSTHEAWIPGGSRTNDEVRVRLMKEAAQLQKQQDATNQAALAVREREVRRIHEEKQAQLAREKVIFERLEQEEKVRQQAKEKRFQQAQVQTKAVMPADARALSFWKQQEEVLGLGKSGRPAGSKLMLRTSLA